MYAAKKKKKKSRNYTAHCSSPNDTRARHPLLRLWDLKQTGHIGKLAEVVIKRLTYLL